jgi:hypothetical protein
VTAKTIVRLIAVTLLMLFLTTTGLVNGETNRRNLRGTVTDGNDQPLKGAVVKIKNLNSLQIRSYITHKQGTYSFSRLFAHIDYEIRVNYHGTYSSTKTLNRFDSRKEPTIDLRVRVK